MPPGTPAFRILTVTSGAVLVLNLPEPPQQVTPRGLLVTTGTKHSAVRRDGTPAPIYPGYGGRNL